MPTFQTTVHGIVLESASVRDLRRIDAFPIMISFSVLLYDDVADSTAG